MDFVCRILASTSAELGNLGLYTADDPPLSASLTTSCKQ